MNHLYRNPRPLAVAAMVAALLSGTVILPAHAGPLTPQHSGAVSYVTGGIGDGEDDAIKGMMHDYSVSMTFAERSGGKAVYLADVPVTIRDAQGAVMLSIKTNGPYLLVNLPRGEYVAEASHGGQVQTRKFSVAAQKDQALVFEWS